MAQDKKIKRELTKLAKKYGRSVTANKGHYKLEHDRLPPISASGSPGSIHNMLREVERDLQRSVA